MFVTAISLKYALLASRWSYGHFLKLIEFYLNNTINFRHLTQRIIQCYTHKMALVSWPQTPWRRFALCIKLPARCGWRNNYRFLCFRVVYVCIYIIRGEYRLIVVSPDRRLCSLARHAMYSYWSSRCDTDRHRWSIGVFVPALNDYRLTEPEIVRVVLRRATSADDLATEGDERPQVEHSARLWSASATHSHRRRRQGRPAPTTNNWIV